MGLHNLKIQSFYQSCERFIHLLFDGLRKQKQDKNKLDANCIMTHLSISVKRADKQMQRITVKWKEEQKIGEIIVPGYHYFGCLRKCVFRFPQYYPTCSTILIFNLSIINVRYYLIYLQPWYIDFMFLLYVMVEVPIK